MPTVVVARGAWWAGAVTIEGDGTLVVEVSSMNAGRALLGATYTAGDAELVVTRTIDAAPTGAADLESLLAHPFVYGAIAEFVDAAAEGVAFGSIFLADLTGSLELTWAGTDLHQSSWTSFTMAGRLLAWVIAQPELTKRMLKQHLDSVPFRAISRTLVAGEQRLVDELIRRAGGAVQFDGLDPRPAVAMDDRPNSSLRFLPAAGTRFGTQASELSFIDVDGVNVLAALHVDEQQHLFELELTKSDFSPVRSIPQSFH